ncbi:efflux RND transporter permease subunit [Engelhardtia mirabilis]|uniref:Multidrug resistance protein MexB n=1 Tax=Engelhardtia mirabilis TaxID=2528011 RepID=A0A518BHW0_9BACT|nr:Multidrug resistance protein MexB [Planctomycetes bacterium Pla133]QDV00894.1 Multidrug resistance protein MexB [Planctomycetes bacterium Pla86]
MDKWIRWFAGNGVAANLLMALILVAGVVTIPTIQVEVFPELSSDMVTIQVPYPGAAPEETEQSICVRIEEAIWDVSGVEEITSTAAENMATVTVEVRSDADAREVLDDVKVRVDAIDTFPDEAEQPIVAELVTRKPVIDVTVFGSTDEFTLRRLAERVREELSALPEISQAQLAGAPPYEISIEVSEDSLRQFGLTFDEVTAAVRRGSIELPGGSVKTRGGEILLRTAGRAKEREAFEALVVRTAPDGSRLTVGDVAQVVDAFADTDERTRFDGLPSAQIRVYRVGDQNALEIAAAVRDYVERTRLDLPQGLNIDTWQDQSIILRDRLRVMIQNGLSGLGLVFVVLALFLRFRLALWVALGIPVSFLGALAMLPHLGGSINLISLFAFILVLGIVVDDAIVVGESVHRFQERGEGGIKGSRRGALDVSQPVQFAIFTTVLAFVPMALLDGFSGRIWFIIPAVVIPTLLFSLIESLLILPAHLAHSSHLLDRLSERPPFVWWVRFQKRIADGQETFVDRFFTPTLRAALRFRYATLSAGLVALALTLETVAGGHIRFDFMPPVEADNVAAQVSMPLGTPIERTAAAAAQLEAAIVELKDELAAEGQPDLIRHWFTAVGSQPFRGDQSSNGGRIGGSFSGEHLAEVTLELAPAQEREVPSLEIAKRWRDLVGEIPGAIELEFDSDLIASGKPVHVRLQSTDTSRLRALTDDLRAELRDLPGVFAIADTFREGKRELRLDVKPQAQALGLSRAELARQVRQGFYGDEAQSIQRGRDDVDVMVRYPKDERLSLADVAAMRVRTPDGGEVPFGEVATAFETRGDSTIMRADRMRAIEVTADVDDAMADPNAVRARLQEEILPRLVAAYPGSRWSMVGEQQEQAETISQLARLYAVALLGIFALMAIPFRSYFQPLIVMSAIPFGLVGAVGGHLLTGYQLSMISVLGVVALGGVVVNDSLVLVDFVNRERIAHPHKSASQAAIDACRTRFRPILLTSLTTFAGLTPLMLERSVQAKFLIPMAISLAFGVAFATFITLGLVPSLYLIQEDARGLVQRLLPGRPRVDRAVQ